MTMPFGLSRMLLKSIFCIRYDYILRNYMAIYIFCFQGELYWTHHWQKNITIPEIRNKEKDRWANQDKFPEDELRY